MNSKIMAALIGLELDDGWVIDGPMRRSNGHIGGYHCVPFTASNSNGQRAFIKVLAKSRGQTPITIGDLRGSNGLAGHGLTTQLTPKHKPPTEVGYTYTGTSI
jgi:hypothetical protein